MKKALFAVALAWVLVAIGYAFYPALVPMSVSVIVASMVGVLCSLPTGKSKILAVFALFAFAFAVPCAVTSGMEVLAVMFAVIGVGIISGALASLVFPPTDG